MKRELFFDIAPDYVRAAVIEDGELCEVHGEAVSSQKLTESLFYGRVTQIRPSVCAAFVDIGLEQNAFLPLADAGEKQLRCGDFIIVQGAAKQATDSKGLRITAKINLSGKSLVLVPGGSGVHISKKVKDEALRAQFLEIGREICPDGCGLIVRTASQELTEDMLRSEAAELHDRWQEVLKKAAGLNRPGVLMERKTLAERLLRDLGGSELARIVTNNEKSFEALSEDQNRGLFSEKTAVELFCEKNTLIFDAFSLEEKIARALRKRVWLPCGGYLVIDSCEAMTVIDVNSGKMVLGRNIEDTALRVNLEAAWEIAHQIRLRDISGMIVVDFIDMKETAHREELVRVLSEAVMRDRSQVKVHGLTRLGLMEMTRKRVNEQLHKQLQVGCSYCAGTGELLSGEEVARRALRQVRRMALSGQRGPFIVRCAVQTASALAAYINQNDADVYVLASSGKHAERFEIEQIGESSQIPKDAVKLKKE